MPGTTKGFGRAEKQRGSAKWEGGKQGGQDRVRTQGRGYTHLNSVTLCPFTHLNSVSVCPFTHLNSVTVCPFFLMTVQSSRSGSRNSMKPTSTPELGETSI